MLQLSARDSMSFVLSCKFSKYVCTSCFFICTYLTWQELHMRLLHQANLQLVLGLVGCRTVGYLELINVECQSYS